MNHIRSLTFVSRIAGILFVLAQGSLAISAPPGPGDIVAPQFDNNGTVIVVDPSTGNRSVLSLYPSIGTGPRMARPDSILQLPNGNFLAAESFLVQGLYQIEKNTGNRTFLAGIGGPTSLGYPASRGTGPWDAIQSVLLSLTGDIIVVNQGGGNYTSGFVTKVDPATGNATLISGLGSGSGPAFSSLQGGAIDSRGHLIVTDYDRREIFDVDLMNGTRSVLSGLTRGAGPAFGNLRDLVVLPGGDIVATDVNFDNVSNLTSSLFRIDPLTGNRSVISSGSRSAYDYQRISLDNNGNLLGSLVESSGSIYSINPTTGSRSLVSGANLGTGPALFWGDMVQVATVPEPSSIIFAIVGLALLYPARKRSG